ncbi:MAG: sigma-70 family RNA polymerase sigma factor [Bryobacter sp.]|nr:sigma-70 family RNA polymerase sigma factor [Bryobacter sp.]
MYSVIGQVKQRQLEFFAFDREYLELLTEGDLETEKHFVSYFSSLIHIKLRHRVRSVDIVEDLRQEIFLRVMRSLRKNSLEHPERLGAFVNAVCNNVLLEHYRGQGRQPVEATRWDDSRPEPVEPRLSSEAELLRAEQRQQVRNVLAELSERDQAILRALFFEEAEKDTVCQRFGVGRDYLRVLLHRAKNRLRASWSKGGSRN